jgi:hypothetical protein
MSSRLVNLLTVFLWIICPEGGGRMFIQNVRNHTALYVGS